MIYRTRFGKEYDLSKWPKEHVAFLRRAYWEYANNMDYERFAAFILGAGSPVLSKKHNGPVPVDTPLYDVATDLEFRLGVKRGHYTKDWDGPVDPVWPL